MTLILTVNGRESIWMLADRRLSYPAPKQPKDDARKFMFLETTDGVAMIGYAGLGATAAGTEPADWIAAVLRGRNFPLERSIVGLAETARRELPKHVAQLPQAGHFFVIPAFLNGKVRLYTIDLEFAPDRKTYRFRYVWQQGRRPESTPRFCLSGSGAFCLGRDRSWIKDLLRLVRASDATKIAPQVVADCLAKINKIAHEKTLDGSVGPQCIVAWRHNKMGVHKGGGAHQFYDGVRRIGDCGSIPTIANGIDIGALVQASMPHIMSQMNELRSGGSSAPLDVAKLNEALAQLPDKPDDNLK